ncbi:C-type lectin domain family 2 member D11-like isoform X2 [Dasypus novemcinctus]|uniref:C-type lectin domain family 2 member D11-like isoform X2 n=1 Tax=Dasypus novemcinctus TaxID=9361 RepID=UPI00265F0970|nr:C-type lectin domain family 2 member D11-like isoform X2 [Dasypus novemcinctus]
MMLVKQSPLEISYRDIFRDDMERGRSGKNWQRKCLAFIAPITVHKVFCGFVTIFVLAAVIIALSVALAVLGRRAELILRLLVPVTCPQRWIGYGFKCFYFSDDTRNWTFSETFCASMGAHLAQFETPEELNFLKRYKGPADHWIGLSRESLYHIWKWTDGTEYNSSRKLPSSTSSSWPVPTISLIFPCVLSCLFPLGCQ